ncbi:hypothetical protein SASPL_146652 [Salvia splendens]|uniref:Uncharacterized protein n=1 Tax=Salvia splendens TaxID=180675 RepID=A0A8X8WDP6_SALSN|nr:hypothetical protein SASPL_146652 [Salvia splendens]
MEVVIDWSSFCGYYSDTRKRKQQVVSEPSILGGERRLESRQFDAGITENRRKLESQQTDARWEKNMQLLQNIISSKPGGEVAVTDKESSPVEEEDQQVEIRWQQLEARSEAHWRCMDVKFDELKKTILDLSFSIQGRSMETTNASCGSRESHVRAEAEYRSYSTDLDPTDCNLSPMQKTEEHKVKGIDSESYFLIFSHDSMNSFVGYSIGVSELSTMGDDSLIEQPSNIVEEESTMRLKDVIAIYEEEFINSRNSSMKFDVAARASFDFKAEGLVDEEEKEVSKEVSMGEFLCMCKGIDGKYVQMDRTFDAFMFLDSIKVPMSNNMQMTNKMMVQNPNKYGWFVSKWFSMPKVKMKTKKVGLGDLITASTQEFGEGIQLVDDAFVFLNGKVTGVVAADSFFFHFAVDTGAGEILDHGKVYGIELEQVFKGGAMTRATHMQVQYGEVIGGKLGKLFDRDKGRLQRITTGLHADDCDGNFKFVDDILILGINDGVLEVFFTSGDIYLVGDDLDKGVADCGELVKKLMGSENELYPCTKELMHFVQHASKPFGIVEGIFRNIDNMLAAIEDIGGLEWDYYNCEQEPDNGESCIEAIILSKFLCFERPRAFGYLSKCLGSEEKGCNSSAAGLEEASGRGITAVDGEARRADEVCLRGKRKEAGGAGGGAWRRYRGGERQEEAATNGGESRRCMKEADGGRNE